MYIRKRGVALDLGILSLAVYLWNDSKQSLQFPNGSRRLVHRGGVLVNIQVLQVGGVRWAGPEWAWLPHLECSGYVEGEEVAVQREDIKMVLSDREPNWTLPTILQPQLLQGSEVTESGCGHRLYIHVNGLAMPSRTKYFVIHCTVT